MVGSPTTLPLQQQMRGYTQVTVDVGSTGGTCGTARSMVSQCSGSGGRDGGGSTASTWGGGEEEEEEGEGDSVDHEVLQKALDAVRHRVKHYRMYIKPSFQARNNVKTRAVATAHEGASAFLLHRALVNRPPPYHKMRAPINHAVFVSVEGLHQPLFITALGRSARLLSYVCSVATAVQQAIYR